MIVRNSALSIPVISVSVDMDKTSKFKDFLKGTITHDDFFGSVGMSNMLLGIVETAHNFAFSGTRVFKHDALEVIVEQPYSQNTLFAIPHNVSTSLSSISFQTRSGKKKTLNNISQVNSGVLIECPLTMIIASMCLRKQLQLTKEKNQLSAAQLSQWQSSDKAASDEIDKLRVDQSNLCLIGEQAIAIHNGKIYFHQPVSVSWLSFVEMVEFSLAPAPIRNGVEDYRLRSIDIFKGISGTTGTLPEIEAAFTVLGVGGHLQSAPWLCLPDKPSFEFPMGTDLKSFLTQNAKYALALFPTYLESAYGGMLFDAKNISGAMYDLAIKMTRLGFPNEFETDSQDLSPSMIVARAFEPELALLGRDKYKVIDEFDALLDVRMHRLNFVAALPTTMDRVDLTFYKKVLSAIRRTRAKWPVEISSKLVMTTVGTENTLELTLPSGVVVPIKIADSIQYDYNGMNAIAALSAPTSPLVDKMVDFMEVVEAIFLYLMSADVKKEDILNPISDTTVMVGGVYRMLAGAIHQSICSPDPVIVIPVK